MRVLPAAACCVVLATSVSTNWRPPAPQPPAVNHKRALIVAIGKYPRSTGWAAISSANDVELVRAGLVAQKFDTISVLPERESTREGILQALAGMTVNKGDVVLFHYSGHGQQLTDDDADEPDGYDEAIVPIDAPATNAGGYRGAKHLRDDEIARALRDLRKRAGPAGNVIAIFDSCFSGAITRGALEARGGPPLGPPATIPQTALPREASGLFDEPSSRGTQTPSEPDLAPYVVISAARFDELDHEMRSPSGNVVGPLSYAMSTALLKTREDATYRSLFTVIQEEMQKRVRNQPQIEGDLDTVVFNGRAVPQRPFIAIASVIDGRTLSLSSGNLLGLERGTTVEVHRAGANSPATETRLATGTIANVTPTTARVTLNAPAAVGSLQNGRVFVTRYTFGDLRMRTQLQGLKEPVASEVRTALANVSAVEMVTEAPDLIVRQGATERELAIVDVATGTAIGAPLPIARNGVGDQVASRIEDVARSRYLRRLTLSAPGLDAGLEIVPVSLTACTNPAQPSEDSCTVTPLDRQRFVTPGHGLSFPVGTYFKLRIRPASRAAYMAVVDLAPDGSIGVLVPNHPTRKETTAPGPPLLAQGLWQFTDPPGNEVFMLVATDEHVDFSPFASTRPGTTRAAPRADAMGAFAPLFDDAAVRTRAAAISPLGAVSTSIVSVTVRPR